VVCTATARLLFSLTYADDNVRALVQVIQSIKVFFSIGGMVVQTVQWRWSGRHYTIIWL